MSGEALVFQIVINSILAIILSYWTLGIREARNISEIYYDSAHSVSDLTYSTHHIKYAKELVLLSHLFFASLLAIPIVDLSTRYNSRIFALAGQGRVISDNTTVTPLSIIDFVFANISYQAGYGVSLLLVITILLLRSLLLYNFKLAPRQYLYQLIAISLLLISFLYIIFSSIQFNWQLISTNHYSHVDAGLREQIFIRHTLKQSFWVVPFSLVFYLVCILGVGKIKIELVTFKSLYPHSK